MTDVTQGNQTELRTDQGEIKDQTPKLDTTSSETKPEQKPEAKTELKPEDKSKDDGKPLLGKDDEKKEEAKGAPEKYEDFKLPEGVALQPESLAEATALFKEINVSQGDAQKLVDFHVKTLKAAEEGPAKEWSDQQKKWRDEIAADTTLAPRLPEIKTNFSKMLSAVQDPALEKDFREMVEFTGAGNNPSFIKMMDKLSQHFTEGKVVKAGDKPAPVNEPGKATGTGAKALYPNLP